MGDVLPAEVKLFRTEPGLGAMEGKIELRRPIESNLSSRQVADLIRDLLKHIDLPIPIAIVLALVFSSGSLLPLLEVGVSGSMILLIG